MTTTSPTKPQLLTLEEVGEILRRPVSQLRWMRHNGTGPRSAKIGGRVTYMEHDVYAWIAEQFELEAKRQEQV